MNQTAGAGETHVDPLTGALVRRISGAGTVVDIPYSSLPNLGGFDDGGLSNHWSTTEETNCLRPFAADGTPNSKLYVPADTTNATGFTPIMTNDPTTHLNYATAAITGNYGGNGRGCEGAGMPHHRRRGMRAGSPNLVEVDFSGCTAHARSRPGNLIVLSRTGSWPNLSVHAGHGKAWPIPSPLTITPRAS